MIEVVAQRAVRGYEQALKRILGRYYDGSAKLTVAATALMLAISLYAGAPGAALGACGLLALWGWQAWRAERRWRA